MANSKELKGAINTPSYFSLIWVFILIISGVVNSLNYNLQAQNKENENGGSTKESDTLYVKEFLLSKDVVERKPVDVVQTFDVEDNTGWCYAEIHNKGPIRNVDFKWYHEGELYYTFEAKVGSSKNWRTYSSVVLREGSWRVELIGPANQVLEEIRFHVSD